MIEGLYSWIKNIVIFLILITAVLNVLPNNQYIKYIRFFTGLIVLILTINPLLDIFYGEQYFEQLFDNKAYKQDVENMQKDMGNLAYLQEETVLKAYRDEIKKNVEKIVTEEGMYAQDIIVVLEEDKNSERYLFPSYMQIQIGFMEVDQTKIKINKIILSETESEYVEVINIKEKLENTYQIESENISFVVEES